MQYIAGQTVYVSGFVTAEKFIINQTLLEIEKRLGYQQGRLTDGASFLLLTSIPSEDDFELKGYSNVPGHRFAMTPDLNEKKLKGIVLNGWQSDSVRLVKVMPHQRHNHGIPNDIQYPPGYGVPQWRLIREYPAKVVGVYTSHDYATRAPYRRNQY